MGERGEEGGSNFDNAPKRVPDLHSQLDHTNFLLPLKEKMPLTKLDSRLDIHWDKQIRLPKLQIMLCKSCKIAVKSSACKMAIRVWSDQKLS